MLSKSRDLGFIGSSGRKLLCALFIVALAGGLAFNALALPQPTTLTWEKTSKVEGPKVLPKQLESASPITISAPSAPTFQFGPTTGVDEAAEWTTNEAYSGSYSVLLASGTEAYSAGPPEEYSAGRVVIPVSKPLADITSISFYYMISEDAEVTGSQDFLTFAPDGETSGYLSPYVILHITKTGAPDHWIVSQTISVPEANKGEWLQFDSTATDLPYYGTLGDMKWHDERWTGGWTTLDAFKMTYMGYTVTEVKVAMGEWSTSELQAAYVDEVAVGAILIADPQYGTVGTKVLVAGYGASPGRRVNIYWDEVRAWSGTRHTGYLGKTTSDSAGDFEVEITVPEQTGGDAVHEIIAYDTEAEETATASFTVIPEVVVSPDAGVPGSTVEVQGTGFSRRADVEMYFDEDGDWPDIDADELVATAETDKFGSFSPEEFDVPDVAAGDYEVWAIDEEDYSAKDVFTVKGFYVVVHPDEGPPGIEVRVRGRLSADSEVDVKFGRDWDGDAPPYDDWDWYTYVLEDVETDEDGFFRDRFEVPSVSAGTYTVMAIDKKGEWATDEFEVKHAPRIELTPDSGEPDDEITIEGWYFTGDSDITLTFSDKEVEIDVTPEDGITTDEDGSFEAEFEVPDVPDGDYTVTAEDEEELSAEADFEVVTPPVPPEVLTVEIHPETLNLKSKGRWITCLIKPPAGYDVEDIDVGTVELSYNNEDVEADWGNVEGNVLMVKFSRSQVISLLQQEGVNGGEQVELTIKSEVDEEPFEGIDTIRVISPGKGRGPKK